MRNFFDQQLDHLNILLTEMGMQIDKAIDACVLALIKRDEIEAKKAIDLEKQIDVKEREIEDLCYRILLQQQPVAKDFRTISAALKMVTDMERIGDQACDIATLTLEMKDDLLSNDFIKIKKMAEQTTQMVTSAIDAFVQKDKEKALNVIKSDDIVDELFYDVKEQIITHIKSDFADTDMSLDYFMISKYFERIGDHATNIAEQVIYSISGEVIVYDSDEEQN